MKPLRKISDTNALLIGVLPLWEDRGDSIHFREVATELKNQGVNAVVLCLPGPEAPDNSVLTELRVSVLRRRFFFQLSWNLIGTLSALRAIFKYRIDVVYTRLDPGMIVGLLVSFLTKRPLVVEMNGLPTLDLKLYRPHNKLLLMLSHLWEKQMYQSAHRIVGAPGYLKYIRDNFSVPRDKCYSVPLGVNQDLFYPRDKHFCRDYLKLNDEFLVVWVGNLTVWQGLDTLLQSACLLKKYCQSARLLIVGDGVSRTMCEQFVRNENLEDTVTLVGHVSYQTVPLYISAADVCVASFPGNRGAIGTISALKTVSYLACARPVVTTLMDELAELIEEVGAGYSVPPDDPIALAKRISCLLAESTDQSNLRCSKALEIVGSERTWKNSANLIANCLRFNRA